MEKSDMYYKQTLKNIYLNELEMTSKTLVFLDSTDIQQRTMYNAAYGLVDDSEHIL